MWAGPEVVGVRSSINRAIGDAGLRAGKGSEGFWRERGSPEKREHGESHDSRRQSGNK